MPVRKIAGRSRADRAARRRRSALCLFRFAGRARTGIAEVTATGPRSEIGKIGQSLQNTGDRAAAAAGADTTARTHVRRGRRRGQRLAVLLYGLLRGGWLDAVLAGIALGMSMLPEEFPVVLTVFLAMGAWRISQAQVLTRRAAAIETLGSATVLCTDKTGTLTENRMTIAELRPPDGDALRSSAKRHGSAAAVRPDLVEFGMLASRRTRSIPMEKAFHELGPAGAS